MERKYKYHCIDCEHCCPFFDDDYIGNCDIDMKEIKADKDRCEQFKLDKSNIR